MQCSHSIQIHIPTPCHEDWDKMMPGGQGRHCGQCNKTVIDFTAWSDAALYEFFAKPQGRVCGRVLASQLRRPIHIPPQPHSMLYRMVVAMGLTLIFAEGGQLQAQERPRAVKTTTTYVPEGPGCPPTVWLGSVGGMVVDERGAPVIGAVITVQYNGITRAGAVTDIDGGYVVTGLEPGMYDVSISYTGGGLTKTVEVKKGMRAVVNCPDKYIAPPVREELPQIMTGDITPLIKLEPAVYKNKQRKTGTGLAPVKAPDVPVKKKDKSDLDRNRPGKRVYTKEELKNMPD